MYLLLTEKKRRLGLADPHFFAKYVCGYEDMTDEDGFHGEMCNWVDDSDHKKVLVLEPRGSLKTSVIIADILRSIVRWPNIRILLSSEEFLTAKSIMAEVVGHIESNPVFIELYGDLKGKRPKKWNEYQITVATRTRHKKEPTITCAGIDVTKVGMHYERVYIDDAHSTKNTTTREQIEKVITWYRLLLSLLDPPQKKKVANYPGVVVKKRKAKIPKKMVITGTRWHYGDLYGWLIGKERERKALGMNTRFHILIKKAVYGKLNYDTPDDLLLWPERLSKEFLIDTKLDQGPYLFSCQYLNEPVDDDSAIFKKSWVRFYDPKNLPAEHKLNTYITLDPVRDDESESTTDDHAAFTVVSFDHNWIGYIREIRRGKWDEYDTLDQLLELNRIWNPKRIGVEAVAWQKVYYRFWKAELLRRRLAVPVTALKTDNKVSKKMRIRSMVPYWKSGLYRVPGKALELLEGNMAIMVDELLNYPRTNTFDCIDALAYIDQISKRPVPSVIMRRIPKGSFLDEVQKIKRSNEKYLGAENVR